MNEPHYFRARSVAEAIEALESANGEGLIVAGGTVVCSLINQRLATPDIMVDISRIADLRRIERRVDGSLFIGALATHDDVLRSDEIQRSAPLLAQIALEISCPRLRNRGTIGGSLCTVGGQGDPATGLIALGAQLHLRGPAGVRTLPVEDFYRDQFQTDIAPAEILEMVEVPLLGRASRSGFCKIGPRSGMDWTQITASIYLTLNNGAIDEARIGMNGVANTPTRPRSAEKLLRGSMPDSIDWTAAADALDSEIAPSGDLIYSEDYKRHLAEVSLRRAFQRALEHRA